MVVVEDGWLSVIHVCKEDMKNKRLKEHNRQDLKEKETWVPGRRKFNFWW
jgi:hypothetical protein